jgi:hypothetical protein
VVSPIVGCVAGLVLAAAVLLRDPAGRASRAFAAFATGAAVWGFAVYRFRAAGDPDTAMRWQLLVYVTLFVGPALYFHLAHAVGGVAERGGAVFVYVLSAVALLVGVTRFDLFVRVVIFTPQGWAPRSGPLAAVWFFVTLGITAATFWPLAAGRRRLGPEQSARPLTLLIVGNALRLLAPVLTVASALLAQSGTLARPLPPFFVEATILVMLLAAGATLDAGS